MPNFWKVKIFLFTKKLGIKKNKNRNKNLWAVKIIILKKKWSIHFFIP